MTFAIHTESGEWYYSLFYHLALISFFFIYLIYGILKKYPMISWTLIGFSGILTFMIGSRIGAMNWEQFMEFVSTFQITSHLGQTDVFGLLFGLSGVIAAKYFLGFKKPVLNVFALAVPVAIFIQRIGCLAAGCCFGSITDSPLAVQYAKHYHIYQHQINLGVVSPLDDHSLPVHPIPIYIMIAALVTFHLVVYTRKHLKKDGSLLLFSMSSLFFFRFLIEFFRDPATNHSMGSELLGLKIIQWVLLGVIVTILPLTYWWGRSASGPAHHNKELSSYSISLRKWILFFTLLLSVVMTNQLLAIRDLVNLFIKITMAGSILLVYYVPRIIKNPMDFTMVLLTFGSLLWMSQTIALNRSDITTDSIGDQLKEVRKWITTGAFIANPSGDYRKYSRNGCDLVEHETFKGKYAGGAWYEQSVGREPQRHALFGAGFNFSSYDVTNLRVHRPAGGKSSIAVGMYFGSDRSKSGYKLGGYLGDLKWITPSTEKVEQSFFFPILQFRAGDLDRFYGQLGLGDDFTQGPFASFDRFLLGINLASPSSDNNLILELGTISAFSRGKTRLYAGSRFTINNSWQINPNLHIGDPSYFGLGLGLKIP